jgi:hypothetical protein
MSATVEQAMRLMEGRKAALVGTDEPTITTNPDAVRLLSIGFDVDPEEVQSAAITYANESAKSIILTNSLMPVLIGFFMDALLTGYVMGAGVPEGVES